METNKKQHPACESNPGPLVCLTSTSTSFQQKPVTLILVFIYKIANQSWFWNVNFVNIRWRSDYIIGFVTPAIGPNIFKKLTRLTAPVHNIRGKVLMKNNIHGFTDNKLVVREVMCAVFHSNFAAWIVCRHFRPCEFLGFVWTDCWGDKSNYVITSTANTGRVWYR